MGSMTRNQIINEALQLAGNTGLGTRAVAWLQTWLDRVYQSYPWPFLKGTLVTTVPPGSGVLSINDPATLRITDVTGARLLTSSGDFIRTLNLYKGHTSGVFSGEPVNVIYGQDIFDPYRATMTLGASAQIPYQLGVDYQFLPPALGADDHPHYPNDETCIQAVFWRALKHQKDDRQEIEAGILARMVAEDRVSEGHKRGGMEKLKLSRRFRQ
jgi:hypothetical protein